MNNLIQRIKRALDWFNDALILAESGLLKRDTDDDIVERGI